VKTYNKYLVSEYHEDYGWLRGAMEYYLEGVPNYGEWFSRCTAGSIRISY